MIGALWTTNWLLAFSTRSPPKIPEVSIPEAPVKEIAAALRVEINRAFAVIRQIALGKDLKQFLSVCQFSLVGHICMFNHILLAFTEWPNFH